MRRAITSRMRCGLKFVVPCFRFKELSHVFQHAGQEGTKYGLLTPAHFLKGPEDSSRRDTAGSLDMVKRLTTEKNHVNDLVGRHIGKEVFPSLHDPEYSGTEEDRARELASGVQGALVGNAVNTVCCL